MKNLLVFPEGAHRAELLNDDDGSVTARWFESDDMKADFWTVTLSADGFTADVFVVYGEGGGQMKGLFGTLASVLQYQSGIDVNIAMQRGA